MRVLMLSWEYPPHIIGGMGRHVMELAPALAAQQVKVHVLTPLLRGGEAYEQLPSGVHVHRVEPPHMEAANFSSFVQQANTLLEQVAYEIRVDHGRFDVIHVHDWLTAEAGILLKHMWHLPLIATIHATERGRQQGYIGNGHVGHINNLEWRLTYEAWRVITCSYFMADQVHDYFGTPHDKIDIIPNAVNIYPDPFSSEHTRQAFRQHFAADDHPLVFHIGRMVYEKGVHVLLESWTRVRQVFPHVRLLIAGTGNYLDNLKARAQSLGIDNDVIFTGYISDADRDRLYAVADAAVFPSIYEPFGITALEAMSTKCPVIVTNTGGLAEVVRLHETGIIVYPNNADSLAWGILHTLQNPKWSHARVCNAFREVCDVYNWPRIATLTSRLYDRVQNDWQKVIWGKEAMFL